MYIFGVSNKKKTAAIAKMYDTVAREYGGEFINTSAPISQGRNQEHSWFEIPNHGTPHNQNTANAIYAKIRELDEGREEEVSAA